MESNRLTKSKEQSVKGKMQRAKGKEQKAKSKRQNANSNFICFLPFAFCHYRFAFCILSFALCLLPFVSSAQNKADLEHLKIQVKTAISAKTLLNRYFLTNSDCDISEFEKLNHLKISSTIPAGSKLIMPIFVLTYNNKTIRSSIGISDLHMAQNIQSYNLKLYQKKVRAKNYKQEGLILVPYHFFYCDKQNKSTAQEDKIQTAEEEIVEEKPTGKNVTKYAIFGKKYQYVKRIDRKLEGKVFYIEGGHGGPDPGAQVVVEGRTICEDEYAYDVSLRVARELARHNATVYIITRDPNDGIRDGEFLICDFDEQTYPDLKVPVSQKARLTQRSDAINELFEKNAARGIIDQRLLVIHVDSRGKAQQTDTFLYYQNEDKKSYNLASSMLKTLESKYAGRRDFKGTLTTRDLHMLRECKPTTVYVELGNIRNSFDRKRLMLANNRQAIANWLAEGFMKTKI